MREQAHWLRRVTALVERRSATTVFLAGVLGAFVVTWPLILELPNAIYGRPGDSVGAISEMWWFSYALHHGQPLLYNNLVGVPLGSGWENIYFDVLQVGLLMPLGFVLGPTVAYNLAVLSSFPLTAWVTYLLARRLDLSRLASAFAGLAFAFMPYHQEKAMVHLMHAHMELFPGFLYFAVRWRQTGAWWCALAAGAVLGLTLWTDPTMTYIASILVLAFFVTSLIARPRRLAWGPHLRAHAAGALSAIAVGALFVPPVVLVASHGGAGRGGSLSAQFDATQRSVTELVTYSARIKEFLQPWHANPLVPQSLKTWEFATLHGSNYAENALTIGFTVLVLAVVGIFAFRRTYAVLLGLAIVVAGYLMTQPPERTLAGITIIGPSHFLFRWLPIFRVYSRFGMLVLFGAALLAGFGFMYLQARLQGRRQWLLALPFLLVAVEFNGLPQAHVLQLLPAPAEYTWLRDQPPGTLIEYPIAVQTTDAAVGTKIEEEGRNYAYYQQVHEHAMFNGATPSSPAYSLAFRLEPYYGADVSSQLQGLDIRYVFVHRAAYADFGMDPDQPLPGYHKVATLDDTDIYVRDS